MGVLLTGGRSSSYLQLVTVLLIFVLVLAVTAFTTKWIANNQRKQGINCNIEVRETVRIANNKFIQLVRIGETYFAIAVCKDTVTMLGEIPKEQLAEITVGGGGAGFRELLDRTVRKNADNAGKPKE